MNRHNQQSKKSAANAPSNVGNFVRYLSAAAILVFLAAFSAAAQNPTKWTLESPAKGKSLKKDEAFKADLKAEIEDGWHLYSTEQPSGGPFPTKISLPENSNYAVAGTVTTSAPIVKADANFPVDGKPLETKFFEKQAVFTVPLKSIERNKQRRFSRQHSFSSLQRHGLSAAENRQSFVQRV